VAFSTRLGGESEYPYSSLNLGLHVGDQETVVLRNRQLWLRALGIEAHHEPCCAQQVHSNQVTVVSKEQAGKGYREYSSALDGIDGMLTSEVNLPLLTFYADCLPVFLFDPIQRIIGLIHSGWKGTAGRISARAVAMMAADFGSLPADILAIIGPGISRCCYEVDAPVADIFRKEFAEPEQLLYSKNQETNWQLDLKRAIQRTLTEAGLLPSNIEDAGICTSCRRDLYYSYRGEAGRCGRMGALIELG
jgi:YfiH family protein